MTRLVGRVKKRVIFAWGTFDLLRARDIEYLKKARALGDSLVVGVYSDAVIAPLYDTMRPIIPQKERMEVLSALTMVDRVILLKNITPINEIKRIAPDVIGIWDVLDNKKLEAFVNRMDIPLIRIKLRARKSTTDIIQKIKKSFVP